MCGQYVSWAIGFLPYIYLTCLKPFLCNLEQLVALSVYVRPSARWSERVAFPTVNGDYEARLRQVRKARCNCA